MRASEKYNLLVNSPISYISLFFTSNFVENKRTTIWDFLMNIQTWKTPPKNNNKYWNSNDFSWYKPEEIWKDIYLYESDFKVSNLAVKEKKVTIFEENTILINCIWDIWRMWILKNKASSNQQITWLLFNEKVIPEYFFYYFLPKKDELISKSSSITLPIINQRKIQELEFNLINIDKQKEFIRYMDYCLESYNNKTIPNLTNFNLPKELFSFSERVFNIYYWENNLKKITDNNLYYIKQLKQAILQEAIEWKLTKSWRENNPNIESASVLLEKIKAEKEELLKQKKLKKQEKLKEISEYEIPFEIPENWSWCRLGEIVNIKSSKRIYESDYRNSWIPFYRSKEIWELSRFIEPDNKFFISKEKFESLEKYWYPKKGDLFITAVWSIWNIWMSDGREFYYKDWNTIQLENNKFIDMFFMEKYLKSKFFLNQSLEVVRWWVYWALTIVKANLSTFPLPPFEEQKEIVKKVDEMMKFCDELEKQSLETKENSENLMKSVLSEVFSK